MKPDAEKFSDAWWDSMTTPEPNTGCILWLGCACQLGYGRIRKGPGANVLAHRAAYERAFGPFDQSLKVCHRCDTPLCVNPDHLFLGSQKENLRDMFKKGRANPRGVKRPKKPVAAAVAVRELALVNSHAGVATTDIVHLIGTSAMVAPWRQVTGVPSHRPTRALVVWRRPLSWTPEPAKPSDAGYQAVATVALGCPLSSDLGHSVGVPSLRRGTNG